MQDLILNIDIDCAEREFFNIIYASSCLEKHDCLLYICLQIFIDPYKVVYMLIKCCLVFRRHETIIVYDETICLMLNKNFRCIEAQKIEKSIYEKI